MSERKLCYKVLIDEITPIPESDNLELARITGWRCVVQKGEFKVGDTALYFEIDSALNPHDDRFAFLKERCYKKFLDASKNLFDECIRIRTIKLRGQLSQGLLIPVKDFCEVRNKKIGESCADVLCVRHYDEVAERAVRETTPFIAPNQKGLFPAWAGPKTDEERVQNLTDQDLDEHWDDELEVTEKIDGTSMTVAYSAVNRPDDPVAVCSRNFELKDMPSAYWDMVHELNLDVKLKEWCETHGTEITIQGELNGQGIQNNRDCKPGRSFDVFRIWNITEGRWIPPSERYVIVKELGLNHVPVLETRRISSFDDGSRDFVKVRDAILSYAEGKTANGNEREGIVLKELNGNGFSFKAVSNAYLLKLK